MKLSSMKKHRKTFLRDGEKLFCGTCCHEWKYYNRTNINRCPECGNMAWKPVFEPVYLGGEEV